MSRIAFAFLWLFVVSIPIEGVLTFPGLGTFSKLLGVLAFAVWALVAVRRGGIRKPAPFHVLFAAFVFWGVLSYAWSIDPDITFARLVTLVQMPFMLLLFWELAQEPRRQQSLMQAYCFGAAIVSLQVVSNYVNQIDLGGFFARYSAWDVDANMNALRIVLSIPLAFYLSSVTSSRIWQWIYLLLVPFGILGIILTSSRSGALALAVALTAVPIALREVSRTRKIVLTGGILASAVALYFVVSPKLLERIATIPMELQTVVEGDMVDANIRIRIWEKGLEVVPDHLLLGVGLGAFRASVADEFHGGLGAGAHNTFLAVLVEEGVIGLGLFLGLIGALFVSLRRIPKLDRRLAIILVLTWSISVFFMRQHDKKHTWFLFGILATQAGRVVGVREGDPGWQIEGTGKLSAVPR